MEYVLEDFNFCFRNLEIFFSNIYLKYDVLVLLKQFNVSHTTWMKILLKKYVSVFQTTLSLIPTHPGRRIVPTTATPARQTIPTPTYWTVRALVSLFNWFPAHWYWYNLHLSPFVEHLMSWILLLMWFTKSNIFLRNHTSISITLILEALLSGIKVYFLGW